MINWGSKTVLRGLDGRVLFEKGLEKGLGCDRGSVKKLKDVLSVHISARLAARLNYRGITS